MRPLTREQVRAVDRRAIQELGLPGLVLMENAGRNAARVVLDLLQERRTAKSARVVVLCGGGNNGGDGYVIARHVHNAGVRVTLCPAIDPGELKGDALINATAALKMGVPFAFIRDDAELSAEAMRWYEAEVLVDALLGTGFTGAVRPHIAAVIRRCNEAKADPLVRARGPAVVAVDLPSGLNCDNGKPAEPTIRADVTVTFVATKVGFIAAEAQAYLGRVVVADIGVAEEWVERTI